MATFTPDVFHDGHGPDAPQMEAPRATPKATFSLTDHSALISNCFARSIRVSAISVEGVPG